CNHILLINFTCYFSEEKILQKGAISNKTFPGELDDELDKGVFFCQAEHELKKEVSGLSDAKFDNFRIDKKLMRNLNMYNKHHVKTCKPADEDQEILLLDSLEKLLTCAKIAYHQPK
uniref:Interleukin 13 n=1 Tax=Cyprinus carpio TaxID=7962 RepID=A0A8C1PE50_CYPCA